MADVRGALLTLNVTSQVRVKGVYLSGGVEILCRRIRRNQVKEVLLRVLLTFQLSIADKHLKLTLPHIHAF